MPLVPFFENCFGDPEPGYGLGMSAVRGDLHDRFDDLVLRHPLSEGAANMQPQRVLDSKCGERADYD